MNKKNDYFINSEIIYKAENLKVEDIPKTVIEKLNIL